MNNQKSSKALTVSTSRKIKLAPAQVKHVAHEGEADGVSDLDKQVLAYHKTNNENRRDKLSRLGEIRWVKQLAFGVGGVVGVGFMADGRLYQINFPPQDDTPQVIELTPGESIDVVRELVIASVVVSEGLTFDDDAEIKWLEMVGRTEKAVIVQTNSKTAAAETKENVIVSSEVIEPMEALAKFIKSKRDSGRNKDYIFMLEWQVKGLLEEYPVRDLAELCTDDILTWSQEHATSPATINVNVGRFSSFFGWCLKRGYLKTNPCRAIDASKIHRCKPQTLSLEQIKTVLKVVDPDCLAWFSMCLWMGLRPCSEAMHIQPHDVDLKRKLLTINRSKVGRWRMVPIPDNIMPVLSRPFEPQSKKCHRLNFQAMREALGLKSWPQDVLRHTAASMWLARHQDAGKVALWLGNSHNAFHRQ